MFDGVNIVFPLFCAISVQRIFSCLVKNLPIENLKLFCDIGNLKIFGETMILHTRASYCKLWVGCYFSAKL